MTKPDKGYEQFIKTFLTLTAPYLKLKYDAETGILYYFYYSKKLSVMKLVKITEDFDEILYFFDLGWLIGPLLKDMNRVDFINAILYSTFFNTNVLTLKSLNDAAIKPELIKAFCTQKHDDPNVRRDTNYLFIDNQNLAIALVQSMFPKCGLRKEIDDLIKLHTTTVDNKKLNYPHVKQWIPALKDKKLEDVNGIIQAHAAYIKNTFKKSVKKYTKETDLDTIIKNLTNYVYDVSFIK